ncbi:hypothetical protein [Pseudomonas fluorescens]|uniref:hypothetical protein n=1 Tax=Pseudomonas TaxID=286 RepID=UPI003D01E004
MKQIIYAGNDSQPFVAEYAVVMDDSGWTQHADIVVVQSSQKGLGTSLYNTDRGRDNVLNRILTTDLPDVRIQYISFNIVLDLADHMEGLRLPIRLDLDDYIAKGNPHTVAISRAVTFKQILRRIIGRADREISYWSGHVVGGCALFYTDLMDPERQRLDIAEASRLLERAGYSRSSSRF